MQKRMRECLDELKKRQKRRAKAGVAATLLTVLAVGAAAAALTRHGIAMTEGVKCGLQEHIHTDACWQDAPACAQRQPKGDAPPDFGQGKTQGHLHTQDCYRQAEAPMCGQEEAKGHSHTDICYQTAQTLMCGQEESESHSHAEGCYQAERALSCGVEESAGHLHTEECYPPAGELSCGLEEHQHTDGCLADRLADVEDASAWDAMYKDVEWSGAWGEDLVTAARMQLGYRESRDNYRTAEDKSRSGYTRYGEFAGDAYCGWDAAFVNFCMHYAGLTESRAFPAETDAAAWHDAFLKAKEANIEYLTAEPAVGDLVFFERERFRREEMAEAESKAATEPVKQMGVVSSCDPEKGEITVIEGDSADEVKENAYDLRDGAIGSYLMLTAVEKAVKTRSLTVEGEGYAVTVAFTADAAIPTDAALNVREVEAGSEEYQTCYEQSIEAMNVETVSFARYFDITFRSADGKKIEPSAPVDVNITYTDPVEISERDVNNAVHFAKGGVEALEVKTDAEGRSFDFSQSSFSISGIVIGQTAGDKSRADNGPLYYKQSITDLSQLDGKQFIITNINVAKESDNGEGPNNHIWSLEGIDAGITTDSAKKKYLGLHDYGENDAGKDSLALNSISSVWEFVSAKNGYANQFYIRSADTGLTNGYLKISDASARMGADNANQRASIELVGLKAATALGVEINRDGTVALYRVVNGVKFYVNNKSGGNLAVNDQGFTAWHSDKQGEADGTAPNNALTLYRLPYVILNPYNTGQRRQGSSSPYRFGLEVKASASPGSPASALPVSEVRIEIPIKSSSSPVALTLPDDAARKKGYNFSGSSEKYFYIINKSEASVYKWKLKGWHNITTGKYCDVSKGEAAEIDPVNDNVFYADWGPDDSDCSVGSHDVGREPFLTADLFDYNELANIGLQGVGAGASVTAQASGGEAWTAEASGGSVFAFSRDSDGTVGTLGRPENAGLGSALDPAFAEKILGFLFHNETMAPGIQHMGSVKNGSLYTRLADGSYEYDSAKDAASYCALNGGFHVGARKETNYSGFLPLNAINVVYGTGQQNFWFGMKNEINYWLNDESSAGGRVNYIRNQPMMFEFTGEDELWAYDEYNGVKTLLLNLSGSGSKYGKIDFSTGAITNGTVGNYQFQPGKHRLTIYYLERNAKASGCKIRFHLNPTTGFLGTPIQAVSVKAEWATKNGGYTDEGLKARAGLYEGALPAVPGTEPCKTADLAFANGWACFWGDLDRGTSYAVDEIYAKDKFGKESFARSLPALSTMPLTYWRGKDGLADGDEVVIGNGLADNQNRVLGVDASGTVASYSVPDPLQGGNFLAVNTEGQTPGISDNCIWAVHWNPAGYGYTLENKGTQGSYLSVSDAGLALAGPECASVLNLFENGNLLAEDGRRLAWNADGALKIVLPGTACGRVRIYRPDESILSAYAIRNTRVDVTVRIKNVSQSSEEGLLAGAEFCLYGADYYAGDKVNPNPTIIQERFVSDADGMTASVDLPIGTYYLVEAKAPTGYLLLRSPVEILVESGAEPDPVGKVTAKAPLQSGVQTASFYNPESKTFTIQVANAALYELPSTGGEGIYGYLLGGSLLLAAAVRMRTDKRRVCRTYNI